MVWEACQTLNGSWGYDRDNLNWKSVNLLLWMLIDSVSKGGNMLLNVGPNARGELDDRALATLEGIGKWMRVNGRSIYGCTQSDFTPPPDCRYTQNGNKLYLHIFAWPLNHIHVKGLRDRIEYAQFLHDGSEVKVWPNEFGHCREGQHLRARTADPEAERRDPRDRDVPQGLKNRAPRRTETGDRGLLCPPFASGKRSRIAEFGLVGTVCPDIFFDLKMLRTIFQEI